MRAALSLCLTCLLVSAVQAEPCVSNAKAPKETPEQIGQMTGGLLSSKVRDLALSSPGDLKALGSAVIKAGSQGADAVGAGLGAAAVLCGRNQPAAGRAIQEFVLGLNSPEITKSFEAVSGDIQSAATTSSPAVGAPDAVMESSPGSGVNPTTATNVNSTQPQSNFAASITVISPAVGSSQVVVASRASRSTLTTQSVVFSSVSASR